MVVKYFLNILTLDGEIQLPFAFNRIKTLLYNQVMYKCTQHAKDVSILF